MSIQKHQHLELSPTSEYPSVLQILYKFQLPKAAIKYLSNYELRKLPYSAVVDLIVNKVSENDNMFGQVIVWKGKEYNPIYLNDAHLVEDRNAYLWLSFREIESDKLADFVRLDLDSPRTLRYVLIEPFTGDTN